VNQRDYAAHVRADGTAMAAAAARDLHARVPSCPEWNVAELLEHMGEVHRFWAEIARRGVTDPKEAEREPPPPRDRLLEWFTEGVDSTASVLEAVDPSLPVWTWSHVKTASFIPRRMAQETAVHRWDAENATGEPRPVEGELAADGIAEWFTIFLRKSAPDHLKGSGETVHLHRTDGPGEWFVRLGDGDFELSEEHAKGDVALRGPASDLLLVLWGRLQPSAVEVLGDASSLKTLLGGTDLE